MDTELCLAAPADWRIRSVKDVCVRVTSGGTPSRREPGYYVGGKWPWVKTQELQDNWLDDTEEHITEEAVALSSAKVLPVNTVLVAMYGATVGQLGILRRPMSCNQACSALVVDPSEADYRFLFFQLLQVRAQLKSLATGAAQQNLSGALIKSLRLPFPSLPEQRAIASILGTLDDKIELNRRIGETLEAMALALFKSWFVDFDPVRAKAEGRDTGLPKRLADLFPDSFEDSELGEIPRGWRVVPLGTLIDTVKGRSYKSEELAASDTALVTLKSFARGGGYRPEGLKAFTGTYKPEQVVRPGELVIACTDVTQAAEIIGRPAIVRGTGRYHRLVASLDTLIVRPRDSDVPRSFLYFLGETDAFVAHTFAHTTGTTVLHLAKEAVSSFRFARPTSHLVERFDALACLVLERIQLLEEESISLAGLRDALLPGLLSGGLRVRV